MFARLPASSKIVWMMKYADDTVVASLLQNEEDVQGKVLDDSAEWCEAVCWMISASKTEELLIDFFFLGKIHPLLSSRPVPEKRKKNSKLSAPRNVWAQTSMTNYTGRKILIPSTAKHGRDSSHWGGGNCANVGKPVLIRIYRPLVESVLTLDLMVRWP